jgi:hypothetical protein
VVSHRVMLDVPRELVLSVAGLLAARRREIGTRKGTRRLTCSDVLPGNVHDLATARHNVLSVLRPLSGETSPIRLTALAIAEAVEQGGKGVAPIPS